MQCPIQRDEQRAASKPWAMTGIAVFIVALLSYLAAIILFVTMPQLNPKLLGVWIFGTALGWRIGSQICLNRMQRIAGEKQTRYGWILGLALLLFGLIAYFLAW